ncbi:MAG: metalloprotease PmbA [Rhodanobacteraceae bacterium]
MNLEIEAAGDLQTEQQNLQNLAEDLLARARAAGASQSEVAVGTGSGLSVQVRKGAVETVEHTRDRSLDLTVYFGQRKGTASSADFSPSSIAATLEQACAIARYTEVDPCNGLADAERMATEFPDLDLWHPWSLDVETAIELGQRIEAAGLAVKGVDNSEGASVDSGQGQSVYANSHGFTGCRRGTRHSLSCSMIARDAQGMQRDYWYDSQRAADALMPADALGTRAGERSVARLGARSLSTRKCAVMFTPEVARGLIGHLLSAASGGALYRQASFLLGKAGEQIFPSWFNITEQPRMRGGQASTNYDAEGVATVESPLVRSGVLARYILGSYSARKLGLETTANAGGVHNIVVGHGEDDFDSLLKRMGTGLLVTELMGQGVSIVTGDYSRGAAGFWVENGVIAYPVEGVTIAANLGDMFANLVAVGADVDPRSHILTGSALLESMTIAGE